MTNADLPGRQTNPTATAPGTAARPTHELRPDAPADLRRRRVPRPPAPPAERIGGAGFDTAFLARPVALPHVIPSLQDDLITVDGSEVIRYTHFSLAQSRSRRVARWVAWNVDGSTNHDLPRAGLKFRPDPRVPVTAQLGDEIYVDNHLDRGHIARRRDLCWGSQIEAQRANSDSFYFTNITPQMDDFNQAARSGLWGELEDDLLQTVTVEGLRISLIGGPVLAADDPTYRGALIPREFYKVVAYVENGRLQARAFLLSQKLDHIEGLDVPRFHTYQVALSLLTERTGVVFDPTLIEPTEGVLPEGRRAVRLRTREDIRW